MDQLGKVANPARGKVNSENEYFPVRVRAREFGLVLYFVESLNNDTTVLYSTQKNSKTPERAKALIPRARQRNTSFNSLPLY